MPSKDFNRFLQFALAVSFMAVCIPADAECPKLYIFNQSGKTLTAVWQALGCAGVYNAGDKSWSTVCEHKSIDPNSVEGYSYNWGTTGQSLQVTDWVSETGYSFDNGRGLFREGEFQGNAGCDHQYTVIYQGPDSDPFTGYHSHKFDLSAGYMYGTNSNANSRCLQVSGTDSLKNGSGVHVWDKCIGGDPQRNRVWQWVHATKHIVNVFDQSFCLHRKTGGDPIKGDPIHVWKCDGGSEANKQWDYDTDSTDHNLIRLSAYPDYCMVRAGASNGDAIHLWPCNTDDQNGRWNIIWEENGD